MVGESDTKGKIESCEAGKYLAVQSVREMETQNAKECKCWGTGASDGCRFTILTRHGIMIKARCDLLDW